jgi:hypothetical protein
MRSHNDLTPYGAATGRIKDRSASQGAILEVPGAAHLAVRLELAGCILRGAQPLSLAAVNE